jgi:hypothetical protein
MRIEFSILIVIPLLQSILVRGGSVGQSDLSTDEEEEQGPKFTYTPSNSNTRPPKLFSNPVIPDTAYHELVPALEVLQDLVTTTPAPAGQF